MIITINTIRPLTDTARVIQTMTLGRINWRSVLPTYAKTSLYSMRMNHILQEIDVAGGPVDQQDAIHSGSIVPGPYLGVWR